LFGAALVDILNIVLQPFAGKKEKKTSTCLWHDRWLFPYRDCFYQL